ncbi:MAG TPA: glycosyltransferase family 1 protein [Roseiflexaceae bacterium]|nr:glycosyltransferase family 1 protein [Roseiflexaceae bacterium]
MRVAISGMFWGQPYTGSGQYLRGLVDGLARVAPGHEYTVLVPAGAASEAGGGARLIDVPTPFDGRSANLAKLWFEQVGAPQAAARLGADLLHIPYAAPPLRAAVPVVATVHDIIWRVLPEYRGGPAVQGYFALVARAIRRAAHILADSEHSRRDIIAHLGCAPERVSTVLLAAREEFRPLDREEAAAYVAERYGLRGPFIYYVGSREARKNLGVLVRAFARLRRSGGPPATLVLAGRPAGGDPQLFPDLDSLIDALGIRDVVRVIDASREDNPRLYAAAALVAYPSRYEGFGLQPLEAMACGTPVVASDASSLPEVVGDAALLAPPDDVAAWTAALWRVLTDTALRENLRARGLAQAATFSYDRVARETVAIYADVRSKK